MAALRWGSVFLTDILWVLLSLIRNRYWDKWPKMKRFIFLFPILMYAAPAVAGETWMTDPEGRNVAVWCNWSGCYSQPVNESRSQLDALGVWTLNTIFFEEGTFTLPIVKGPLTRYGEGGSRNYRRLVRELKKQGYKKQK